MAIRAKDFDIIPCISEFGVKTMPIAIRLVPTTFLAFSIRQPLIDMREVFCSHSIAFAVVEIAQSAKDTPPVKHSLIALKVLAIRNAALSSFVNSHTPNCSMGVERTKTSEREENADTPVELLPVAVGLPTRELAYSVAPVIPPSNTKAAHF